MKQHRNLAEFTRWFLSEPIGKLRPPNNAVHQFTLQADHRDGAKVHGVVLYRQAPFQVELFSILPTPHGIAFPEHRHPGIDSIEFFLSGRIVFTVNGKRVASDEQLALSLAPDGASPLCGAMLRVRPKDFHGASAGPEGGSFLSIQRWRSNSEPTSVALDWEGAPHLDVIAAGNMAQPTPPQQERIGRTVNKST